jgi:hypothetical protein
MATNPLKVETKKPKLSAQEWCDRGNRILAGIEPMTKGKFAGEYMHRTDIRWVVVNNHPAIEWAQ